MLRSSQSCPDEGWIAGSSSAEAPVPGCRYHCSRFTFQAHFMNTLYYGDNRDILPRYIKDESVDLIYLDPPFNSNQSYNVLFAEQSGERSAAQIKAFEDTWHWDTETERWFEQVVSRNDKIADLLVSLRRFLGSNDMMAYLTNMAPCLIELRRVLKPTGSIYLHCDPTASHYLKLLMDAVFGATNYRNEIIWKRAQPKSHTRIRMSRAHDVILFYAKSEKSPYKCPYKDHDPEYLEKFYKYVEPKTGRRYRLGDVTNPNKDRPNLKYEFPPKSGVIRVWRWTKDRMKQAWKDGKLVYAKPGVVVQEKRYLDEMEGTPITDSWDDIEHLHGINRGSDFKGEGLGYPTQKPEALLERIINASSNKGDVVLDPFCGCGTAVAVAQKLDRKWIGIDITHLAIRLIKNRLFDAFGLEQKENYAVVGEPVDIEGAKALANQDKMQFQQWALGLVNARPEEVKRGMDRGIDGRRTFFEGKERRPEQIIISVKGGGTSSKDVRDLNGTIKREKAAIGLFLTLKTPTREMNKEAAAAGFYTSDYSGTEHPKLQILTIEDLLQGVRPDLPPLARAGWSDTTFKKAPRSRKKKIANEKLDL
jgi:site-specific DNA-methyltransferase (adenine-specific)